MTSTFKRTDPQNGTAEFSSDDAVIERRGAGLGVFLRMITGLVFGLATSFLEPVLIDFPLAGMLDAWAVLCLTAGLLLGPAGVVGSAIAYGLVKLPGAEIPIRLLAQAGAYSLMGMLAFTVFRVTPKISRGLVDLRSFLGFLSVAASGSLILAGIGSATLFLGTQRSDIFWTGAVYWFSGALTSLLIVAPFLLVVATWKLSPWLVPMPGEESAENEFGREPVVAGGIAHRNIARDIFIGMVMVVGITAVISPLVHLHPHYGGWLALLYLVPILWGSTSRGLRGGVVVASGSGVAYLVGNALTSIVFPAVATHKEVLGQFVGLVILALVGAITGVFQQARLSAESAALQSKRELESRHESLALVHSLADRLKRTLDIETIAKEAVEALNQLNHPPMVAVYVLDDSKSLLDLKSQYGFEETVLAGSQTLPVEGSLSGIALADRDIAVSDDFSKDTRLEPMTRARLLQAGYGSGVSVPMVFEQEALGVINLIYREPNTAAHQDFQALSTIGRTVALAIVNARHVARLEHAVFHDALTGLPNREGLLKYLSESWLQQERNHGVLALVVIDIDRFSEINDALGHPVGDQLLLQVGPRIVQAMADRSPSVFRLEGDAFVVVPRGLATPEESEAAAAEVVASLAAPFEISGMTIQVEVSVGIAVFPDGGSTAADLLRCADVAVHHAKRRSSRIVRYGEHLDRNTRGRIALAADLARAIKDDQLVLHFQPKVMLADGGAIGFEALVRWAHPELGLLPPDQFIPLAEVGDLIHPLTYWVVEHALLQLKAWHQVAPGLTMAVNLSTRNLLDDTCAERLEALIEGARVDPEFVEFELTETALLIDPEAASATLSKIVEFGSRVVIDDFGTGYSSMAFLKKCPINALKIDRSFVGDMLSDKQSRAIVRATVQLAEDLGLAVVAEGIEDADTVTALAVMGCEIGQGFYFQHPAPADRLEQQFAGLRA